MTKKNGIDLLEIAINLSSQKEVADELGVEQRTVRRWMKSEVGVPASRDAQLRKLFENRFGSHSGSDGDFTFIDLFAGIGGIRQGFEDAGGHCVFSSEWDKFALQTYRANYGNEDEEIWTDIKSITAVSEDPKVNSESIQQHIPDHDVLLAGFPCQPFSLAGVSKKNSLGKDHGFMCEAQGTLFFDVARIIEEKKPRAFLLENVKNLRSHDGGKTYEVIRNVLDQLGYHISDRVIDAKGFVPQHRERIYIVGFRKQTAFSWNELDYPDPASKTLAEVLHPGDGTETEAEPPYTEGPFAQVGEKYTLSENLWNYLQAYRAKHEAAGNGFGYSLVGPNDTARTLSARYHKDGSEILISQGSDKRPRRLTPRECARLMGFGDDFKIPVSDTQAYRQFGNCVVVPVIREIAKRMVPHLMHLKQAETLDDLQPSLPLDVPETA